MEQLSISYHHMKQQLHKIIFRLETCPLFEIKVYDEVALTLKL